MLRVFLSVLIFLCFLALSTFAQTNALGLTRGEVLLSIDSKRFTHNIKESMTESGMPYIACNSKDASGGEGFYFENDICVEYRVVLLEVNANMLLEKLRNDGYTYKDGAWLNKERQIVALVKKENMFFNAYFMTFDYFLSTTE
jgi:hypothetical protein